MIGDPTGKLTRGFNVMIEEAGLAERGTFLVDPDGLIQVAEIHAGGIGRSAKDMLRKVKPLSMFVRTMAKFAQQLGSKAAIHLSQVLT